MPFPRSFSNWKESFPQSQRGFEYLVVTASMMLVCIGMLNGDEVYGQSRLTLPYRMEPNLINNWIGLVNYQSHLWSLVAGMSLTSGAMLLIGKFRGLARALFYTSSLMLYLAAYGELDPAFTFLLYAQVLLFFHYPKEKGWKQVIGEMGAWIIPLGVALYLMVVLSNLLQQGFWANGEALGDWIAFSQGTANSSFPLKLGTYGILLSMAVVTIGVLFPLPKKLVGLATFLLSILLIWNLEMWGVALICCCAGLLAYNKKAAHS